jgi:hypothetical protein
MGRADLTVPFLRFRHFIDKSLAFQGPQIPPKVHVEGILDFHWLAALHHLRTAFSEKYESLVTNLAYLLSPIIIDIQSANAHWHPADNNRAVSRIFLRGGGAEGAARVVKVSIESAKQRGLWKFWKAWCSQRRFPAISHRLWTSLLHYTRHSTLWSTTVTTCKKLFLVEPVAMVQDGIR